MKTQFLSHSMTFLALGLAAACAAYTRPAARESDVLETAIMSYRPATARTLARRDIAPYEARPLIEALADLRPDWLRLNPSGRANAEGNRAVLYVNDIASGDLGKLQLIASDEAIEVRLLSASEAWGRFGPSCRCPAGAILVRTRGSE